MSSLLVVWTIVLTAGSCTSAGSCREVYGWKPIGIFVSENRCREAARQLNFDEKTSRCLVGAES